MPVRGGRTLRRGALVRSDSLDNLTESGWQALENHGVRTIIDLRNEEEVGSAPTPPGGIERLHLPHDCWEDRKFWKVWAGGPQFGTPLYYRHHLRRFPERSARVLKAIAQARPGGVLFHCQVGRDRTGMIALLLLHLLRVERSALVDDYQCSHHNLQAYYHDRGLPDQGQAAANYLRSRGTSAARVIDEFLGPVGLAEQLSRAGFSEGDRRALLDRCLGEARPTCSQGASRVP